MSEKIYDINIYHERCSDGIASAWVCQRFNPSIHLISCIAGKNPMIIPVDCIGKKIIFTDICPSTEYLEELCKYAEKVTILDHHVTAYQKIEGWKTKPDNLFTIFVNNQSGCMITWDYFYPGEEMPFFIQYIGDRDLWKWELPYSKEINEVLFVDNYITFEGLTKLDNPIKYSSLISLIKRGEELLTEKKILIQRGIESAKECKFVMEEKTYGIWLYTGLDDLRSDIGSELTKKTLKNGCLPDFCVHWRYNISTNEFWLSMRSTDELTDVSKICQKYGGGGHRNASGCTLPPHLLPRDIFHFH